jgi:hypothetical protein
VQVSFPGNNYPETMGTLKYAFVLPIEKLAGDTVYRITVEFSQERGSEGKLTSCFRTAASNNARGWDTRQQR